MTAPIPLLTIPEAAAVLRCHRNTVHRLIRKKRLKAVKVGRLTRVRATALEDYLSSTTRR